VCEWSFAALLYASVFLKLQYSFFVSLRYCCNVFLILQLMDGRKPVGGKLEVKVRIRHPILTKQVEQIREKWLIIDDIQ
jgi:coiled-coil and C2 domain-containing protein 1